MNALLKVHPASLGIQLGAALLEHKLGGLVRARHETRQLQLSLREEVHTEAQRQRRLRITLKTLDAYMDALLRCLPGSHGHQRQTLLLELRELRH